MPLSVKVIAGYILAMTIWSWYSLLRYGLGNPWVDAIYLALFPVIAIGLAFRRNRARLALMVFSLAIVMVAVAFITLFAYTAFVSSKESVEFAVQPMMVLATALAVGAIHFAIYLAMRRKNVREYFGRSV